MTNENCASCLLKSKATKNLKASELNLLGENCVQVSFDKGETILKQNTLSTNIVYLKTGLVKLIADGPKRTQILKIKKAPCYLGLPTTMGDKINNYSIIALEKSVACYVEIKVFKELLKISPEFSYEIMLDLCQNELFLYKRFVKLLQNQIYGRLATNLLFFSNEIYGSDEFDLPLNRNEIADLICTSRETVSRLFTDFSKDNIIKIEGKHIKLLNKRKLEEISKNG
ncbi:Crp/Fnr family transcriptional regulator [Carboxylicivirga caseinilyticus]|uniref:Crp/Fnr family transcriptional regulator n=1 Tax=Carboxylicivirga caseinilyticus TaxID=3417572 RepID=UPI003D33B3B5|nr:Crp/Fnr family transcriptional regulator [Marinilabiliaceae bacterium A049]